MSILFRRLSALGLPIGTLTPAAQSSDLPAAAPAAHIARAALEGIAFQVADVLTAMESDSVASNLQNFGSTAAPVPTTS